jgi:hypothetical protein
MPTRQATSDRALATLNKFCRQELLGAGEAGSGQVFQRGMQEHERSGVMRRREQLTNAARDQTEHQSMQLPN